MSELKYLACSDIQFPLHDQRALTLWMDVLKWFKPDLVDVVGDIDDADSTSRWAVGPEQNVSVNDGGARLTRELLGDIRTTVKKADVHLYDGNHGWTRHRDYLLKNAPQFLDQITPNVLYGYEELGIEFHYYQDLPFNRFNDMYVHHGVAVSKHAGGSVQSDMESFGVSLIRGHSHRVGSYRKTYEISGQVLEGFEIGHLMDVKKADYSLVRNWQQGFGYGYVSDGRHQIQEVQIKDYTCWVAGKKFSA